MNFLAHLYLADDTPEALIGSIMPDLAKPRDLQRGGQGAPSARTAWSHLPAVTLQAIAQHRGVDAFTDTHAVVGRSKERLRSRHGRFAGILVDVFYDHFLARDWPGYSATPLPEFVTHVHAAFRTHAHLMPTVMRGPVDRMIEQRWLAAYATETGIETTLRQMSRRLSQRFEREVHLDHAVADLQLHNAALTADFHEFFPQLIEWAKSPSESPAGNDV